MRRLLLLLPLLVLPLLVSSACKPGLLPQSSVPDTKENRAVKEFLDTYKSATECRSVDGIMDLVAPDFFEGLHSEESRDKYGYSELRTKLQNTFAKIDTLTLSYHIQKIERKENLFFVYYYFVQRALVSYPSEPEWVTVTDVNRMVLRMKGKQISDGFEILSGI